MKTKWSLPINFLMILAIIVIGSACDRNGGSIPPMYTVRVEDTATNKGIRNAKVIVEAIDVGKISDVTDVDGYVRLSIPNDYVGKPGRLIVEVDGYLTYRSEINLDVDRLPTRVLLETPTPTLIPTLTNTPVPTATNTPTSTLKPTLPLIIECQTELARNIFRQAQDQDLDLRGALGNPLMPYPSCLWSSYQSFVGGAMIWRSDTTGPTETDIYVLFKANELPWEAYKSGYKAEFPKNSCYAEPPAKSFQPIWGFGKVWCDKSAVKQQLGFAVSNEEPRWRPWQNFDHGWLILIDNTIYALFKPEGTNQQKWKRISIFDYQTISLKDYSELPNREKNLGLDPGLGPDYQKLLLPSKIPFDIGWKASTQCTDFSSYPDHFQININISQPLKIFLLMQAGWGIEPYKNKLMGKVSLEFNDGSLYEIPLILGENIRDWADRTNAVTTVSSLDTQLAWEGNNPDGIRGRIDVLSISIPDHYIPLNLKSIQIWDESQIYTESLDPCIHLLAVTVRYLP